MPIQSTDIRNGDSGFDLSKDIWSSYWHGPRLTCSLSGPGIGYIQPLVDTWKFFFKTVNDAACILDIATGNGAVAIIANDSAKIANRQFVIHAIDQADIDPAAYLHGTGLSVDGINFHPRTLAERTGFPDAYFDIVTGQYALEYTDIEATILEIARVLKPGGLARFVIHMRDSEIYNNTKLQLNDIDFVRNEHQLLNKARRMMITTHEFEMLGSADKRLFLEAKQARDVYLHAAKIVDRAVPNAAYKEIFIAILKMVAFHWENRKQSTLEQFILRSYEMDNEIANAEKRHAAMCDSAMDRKDVEKLLESFKRYGFDKSSMGKLKVRIGDHVGEVGWDVLVHLTGQRSKSQTL
jgi:SAM-dependent methyltransferase